MVLKDLSLPEGGEMVVIDDCFFDDGHELVDAVDEVGHAWGWTGGVWVILADEVDEFLLKVEEHAFLVVEVFLEDHWEF